ncbi:MAG: hemolysin family protein [Bacteroidota bacterium]|nr:hemolysin family protein [Bacteroidota bacterium]MDP4231117.1 hemolysin family protein [Bacteroidota bacterium]
MDIVFHLFLVVLFISLNGFFVAAEFAIVKVRRTQITGMIEAGNEKARLLKSISDHINEYLAATQVGITLASLALGWVGEPTTAAILAPLFSLFNMAPSVMHTTSIIIGFAVITGLHIVIGEQLPKMIAIGNDQKVALRIARPLHIFFIFFNPIIRGLNGLVNILMRLLGVQKSPEGEGHTAEELKTVLMESAKRGVVTPAESDLLESVFEFTETTAQEVMVHRSDVIGIDLATEPREIMHIIQNDGFSRLPVYKTSLDEITGILYVKDLLPHFSQLERFTAPSQNGSEEFYKLLERATRPVQYVSETQPISKLLLEFRRSRVHMGIVVSEHGGVEGIITLEDILEELVGEIRDESDLASDERSAFEIGEALYVDPSMSVSDFNDRYEDRFPKIEESAEYQTISGFVQKISGRIPNVGDEINSGGMKFTIKRKIRHRLEQIKIERMPVSVEESEMGRPN